MRLQTLRGREERGRGRGFQGPCQMGSDGERGKRRDRGRAADLRIHSEWRLCRSEHCTYLHGLDGIVCLVDGVDFEKGDRVR